MKKIITMIVLSMIYICPVKALEEDITNWQEAQIENSDAELLNTERRYMWYKENAIYSAGYYIEGDNPSLYPYKVESDYIETSFSNWIDGPVSEKPGRTIEQRMVHRYHELKPVRYIFFKDVIGGFTTFRISELNVLINGEKINYDISCNNCSSNFEAYIKNGIVNEDNAYISNNGSFKIDLGDFYSLGKIRLELYMYDPVPNTKQCKIYMNDIDTIDGAYAYKEFETYVISSSYLNPEKYLIILDFDWIVNPVYMDWVYIEGFLNTTYYRQMQIANEYRYKDITYRYYGIEIEYLEGYSIDAPEGYIKDEEQYKDYYQYKIIEKNKEEENKDPEDTSKIVEEPKGEIVSNDNQKEQPKITYKKKEVISINNEEAPIAVTKDMNKEAIKEENKRHFIKKSDEKIKKDDNYYLLAIGGSLSVIIIMVFLLRKK